MSAPMNKLWTFDGILSYFMAVLAVIAAASGHWDMSASSWAGACYFKLHDLQKKSP
jgi:hypothetical protein